MYLAREDKAERFARNFARHGGLGGAALVECLVRIQRPKYVSFNDDLGTWRDEGYDACRADHTSASRNMEWCISSPEQIDVIRWYTLPVVEGGGGGGMAGENSDSDSDSDSDF